MRPAYIAIILWFFAACATFGIVNILRTGIVHGDFKTFHKDEEPVKFMMAILGRMLLIPLAILKTSYAFGLSGDPLATIYSHIPCYVESMF